MIYILICLIIIQVVLLVVLYRKLKMISYKLEDVTMDVQICITKAEQLYRKLEVLAAKIEDVTRKSS